MKTHLFRSSVAIAVVAMLAACGGGGESDVGSKVVQISFDQPQGILEAGRLITVTGRAVSKNAQLKSMNWTVNGAGAGNSAPTVTNADCANVTRGDSSFGAGSSNWTCVLTLQAPKTLSAATTYDLGLSASSATYSGKGSTQVTVLPATADVNPVQVQFGALPEDMRAGKIINIPGIISSSASQLTNARWAVVNTGATQNAGFPLPVLENSDCASHSVNVNPSGQESSTWTCPVRMIVSPRLLNAATYKLSLVGTNANGFSLSNVIDVPVNVALPATNKVSVTLEPAPLTARAGDKITLRGTVKSTDSKLDIENSHFSVLNVVAVNPHVGVQDPIVTPLLTDLEKTTCVRVTNPNGQIKDELSCSATLTVPTSITEPVVVTYGLVGADDEGAYNYANADVTVQSIADAFGARADVAYNPTPVVPGAPVNLTCAAQGGSGTYTYSWRVASSGGTSINLSSATTTTGAATFNAPSPLANTDVVVECGVANGSNVFYTPLTITIPGSTSPLGFRADVSATPNPVQTGNTVNLTCAGQGVTGAAYSYAWSVTNNAGTPISLTQGGPGTGTASFVAPTLPAVTPPASPSKTVTLSCAVSDGTRVINQNLDVVINP